MAISQLILALAHHSSNNLHSSFDPLQSAGLVLKKNAGGASKREA